MENREYWPGWQTVRQIGKGGFGAVYEIQREVFGDTERCALKIIKIPKDSDEIEYMKCGGMDDESITSTLHSQVGDIINEYKLMTRMRENPNIVHCDDFRYTRHEDDLGWDIYIKMELLTPLMKVMDRMQSEEEIIRLGIELCNALIACQKNNIIHRDIKPQNIFISPEGYYKLGDFGIARTMEHTTKATAGIGTYSFMAPEVAMGKTYGQTVDIYSLGLVLYCLLNERRGPFVPLPPSVPTFADNDKARLRRYSGEQIPAPKYGSEPLKAIVLKACAFDPKDRYQTAREMMEALKRIASEEKQVSQDIVQTAAGENFAEEQTVLEIVNIESIEKNKTRRENRSETQIKKTKNKKVGSRSAVWIAAALIILAVTVLVGFFAARLGNETASPEMNVPDTSVPVQETTATQAETAASPTDAWKDNVLAYPLVSTNLAKENVITITFLDSLDTAPETSVDVSKAKNGRVLLWLEENKGYYDLYIAGEGGVNAAEVCTGLFSDYTNLESIQFNGCFYTDGAEYMISMFEGCESLTELDLESFDTSGVKNMTDMFSGCKSLTELNISSFDTSNVQNMKSMFEFCTSLTKLDLTNFDTSNVTNMNGMFCACESLTELNVSSFDSSNVTNMGFMFWRCDKLTNLDLSKFNTDNVVTYNNFMNFGVFVGGRPWEELFE